MNTTNLIKHVVERNNFKIQMEMWEKMGTTYDICVEYCSFNVFLLLKKCIILFEFETRWNLAMSAMDNKKSLMKMMYLERESQ